MIPISKAKWVVKILMGYLIEKWGIIITTRDDCFIKTMVHEFCYGSYDDALDDFKKFAEINGITDWEVVE